MTLILFDIDLTLVHTNGAGRLAMEEALFEIHGVPNATAGMRFDGRTDRAIFEEALVPLGACDAADYSRLVESYLARLPGALERVGGHLLPGVEALLDRLALEDVAVGLATGNLRSGAMAKLEYFGLWDRFDGGGFGDNDTVRAHVVRAGIEELARLTNRAADAQQTIVLGDTPLDVEAAHAAGARALGVATGRYPVAELLACGADWAFEDLSDTEAVLSLLLDRTARREAIASDGDPGEPPAISATAL